GREDRRSARPGRARCDQRPARRGDHTGVGGESRTRLRRLCDGGGQGHVGDGRAVKRVLAIAFVAFVLPASVSGGTPVTVFAASSLTEVFPRITASPRYSFAGSDQLALQIRQGAPADVYAAASPKYTQLLYRDGFVQKRVVFATNKLIVLVPRSNPAHITTVYDLRREGIKLVIGDRTVPIGSSTRQILDPVGFTNDRLNE